MTPQEQIIKKLGKDMVKNPHDYIIDRDGKLFSKCLDCSEWHCITDLYLK